MLIEKSSFMSGNMRKQAKKSEANQSVGTKGEVKEHTKWVKDKLLYQIRLSGYFCLHMCSVRKYLWH